MIAIIIIIIIINLCFIRFTMACWAFNLIYYKAAAIKNEINFCLTNLNGTVLLVARLSNSRLISFSLASFKPSYSIAIINKAKHDNKKTIQRQKEISGLMIKLLLLFFKNLYLELTLFAKNQIE